MNSKNKRVVALGIAVLLFSTVVFANNMNTGGQKGVVRSMSSYTLGLTGINVGGTFKYDRDFKYVSGPGGVGETIIEHLSQRFDGLTTPGI